MTARPAFLMWLAVSACLFQLCARAGALQAQTLRGQVVLAGQTSPMVGARVVLIDSAGRQIGASLTNEDGRFVLRSSEAGTFTLRIEMIGAKTRTDGPLRLTSGAVIDRVIQMEFDPIPLEAITVSARTQCSVRPNDGAVQVVWDEVRKALAAESLTRRVSIYDFDVQMYQREVLARGGAVVRDERRRASVRTIQPFMSRSAQELSEKGYLGARGDEEWLYAPTADVLLSESFLDTHCFFLRTAADRPDEVGLAFEPVRGRAVTDIEGTLWVNRVSAELRSMDFRYTRLPGHLGVGDYGGRVDFRRLPTGGWIVNAWAIRMPVITLAGDYVRGVYQPRRVVRTFNEQGGLVVGVKTTDGKVLIQFAQATLAGSVASRITNDALAGAEVFIVGTAFSTSTNAKGQFVLGNLPEGTYNVSFRHPAIEALGYVPAPVGVELRLNDTSQVHLHVPREALYSSTHQPGRDQESGRIEGTVTEFESGRPLGGVTVRLREVSVVTTTDENGRFRFRGVRGGSHTMEVELVGYESESSSVEVAPGGWIAAKFILARRKSSRTAATRDIRPGALCRADAEYVHVPVRAATG